MWLVHYKPHMGHELMGGKDSSRARAGWSPPPTPFPVMLGGFGIGMRAPAQPLQSTRLGEAGTLLEESTGSQYLSRIPSCPLDKTKTPSDQLGETSMVAPYLRDAGVQHRAEEGLAIVRADGGRQEGQQVVFKKALAEELVEQSAGVEGPQGALEPRVLDGDVHVLFGDAGTEGW